MLTKNLSQRRPIRPLLRPVCFGVFEHSCPAFGMLGSLGESEHVCKPKTSKESNLSLIEHLDPLPSDLSCHLSAEADILE
jgi:hypothetical protein